MPSLLKARFRHAQHYQQIADRADILYLEGETAVMEGLALFDQERAQIDSGWEWLLSQPQSQATDTLLCNYASATAYVGHIRYHTQRERIPQLEAALAAARRLGLRSHEGAWMGNLGNAYYSVGEPRRAIEYHEQ